MKIIPKPNKSLNNPKSYRPISLSSISTKIWILTNFENDTNHKWEKVNSIRSSIWIPAEIWYNIDQVHRLVNKIMFLKRKQFCSAAFPASQTLNCVWHDGFLFKVKTNLPNYFYSILRFYLVDRNFLISCIGNTNWALSNSSWNILGQCFGTITISALYGWPAYKSVCL